MSLVLNFSTLCYITQNAHSINNIIFFTRSFSCLGAWSRPWQQLFWKKAVSNAGGVHSAGHSWHRCWQPLKISPWEKRTVQKCENHVVEQKTVRLNRKNFGKKRRCFIYQRAKNAGLLTAAATTSKHVALHTGLSKCCVKIAFKANNIFLLTWHVVLTRSDRLLTTINMPCNWDLHIRFCCFAHGSHSTAVSWNV